MDRKIFDSRGFLSKEGKAFVDDNFTKEVRRILATATSSNDALIISSILKSIIGEETTAIQHNISNTPKSTVAPTLVDARLIQPGQNKNKVLQFQAVTVNKE